MKKLFISLLLLLIGGGEFAVRAEGLLNKSGWSYSPVITTTNNVYGNVANTLFGSIPFFTSDPSSFYTHNRWWIPQTLTKWDVLNSIDTPAGKASTKFWDWGLTNYSIGYQVGYMSRMFPLGFSAQVDYERRATKAKMPGMEHYTRYAKQMVVPTVLLSCRFGDYATRNYNIVAEIGGSYDYTFKCKGDYTDTESVNNGFTGIVGIGYVNTLSHVSVSLRYEHDFYDYFNTDFTVDGMKPYEGIQTKHGQLAVYFSVGF